MRKWPFFVAGAIVLAVCGGCCPSLSQVIKMRQEPKLEKVSEANESLKEWFGKKPNTPIWRAEAMTTFLFADERLDLARKDPRRHRALIEMILKEYHSPGIESPASRSDRHRVKVWAVYTLGQFRDPSLLDFFVGILEEVTHGEDADFQIRLAALNSLALQMEAVSSNVELANRILYQIPALNRECSTQLAGSTRAGALQSLEFFRTRLNCYTSVVELLPTPAGRAACSHTQLMQLLQWNYQMLACGDHKSENMRATFETNVAKLYRLAWDRDREVGDLARIILSEFAPLFMFGRLMETVSEEPLRRYDAVEAMAALLGVCDAAASKSAADGRDKAARERYQKDRRRFLNYVSLHAGEMPRKTREIVYARFVEQDPWALAEIISAHYEDFLGTNTADMLQVIRYLSLLRTCDLNQPPPEVYDELARMIAFFMRSRDGKVREQVVSNLLDEEPLMLAAGCLAPFENILTEDTAGARYLIDTYIRCLVIVESRAGGENPYTEDVETEFGGHPYWALAAGVARPEIDMKASIVKFLVDRDVGLLTEVLADDVLTLASEAARVDIAEYAMLGDAVQKGLPSLDEPLVTKATRALETGLTSPDEEIQLLCCRYLLEIGQEPLLSTEDEVTVAPSVRTLLALKPDIGEADGVEGGE